jgi:hypothetical protein
VEWEGSIRRVVPAAGEKAAVLLDWTAIGETVGAAPTEGDSSVAIKATPATRESKGDLDFE